MKYQMIYFQAVILSTSVFKLMHLIILWNCCLGRCKRYFCNYSIFPEFNIAAFTGTIFNLNKALDYEDETQSKLYHISVHVSDGMYTADATVNIQLLDVNDNSPIFELTPYSKQMTDNVTAGYTVIRVCPHLIYLLCSQQSHTNRSELQMIDVHVHCPENID